MKGLSKKLLFLLILSLFGLACQSSPSTSDETIRSNINPDPVYFRKLGYFLFVLDVEIPKARFAESEEEQLFISNYLADQLAAHLQEPFFDRKIEKWKVAEGKEKRALWQTIRRKVEDFLARKTQKLNADNKLVKILRIVLIFRWRDPGKKKLRGSTPSKISPGKKTKKEK